MTTTDEPSRRGLPKRFYKTASVAETEAGRFGIRLDGRPVRTPAKAELAVPSAELAQAIAAEWEAQGTHVDPATMPLTRLANSAIDGVAARADAVRADIVTYAGSDLMCYRAEATEALQRRQADAWDPVLVWASAALGADFVTGVGIMPVSQPDAAKTAIARAVEPLEPFALCAVHVMTTLTGSCLLALAHLHGRLTAEEAWAAAHVDEDWQIGKWGEDAEAKARRARRWTEMQAASQMLELVR